MIGINISKFDKAGVALISALPQSLRPFFELISYIGHPITTSCIGFMIVVYGIFKQKPAIALSGSFVWLALILGTIIKNLLERTRPLTEYVASMFVHSYSFPSGHTTGSTVAFGLLAYYGYHLLPAPYCYITAVLLGLLIVLVGVSRVYLGAHYPTDVIGGWLLGVAILAVVIFIVRPL